MTSHYLALLLLLFGLTGPLAAQDSGNNHEGDTISPRLPSAFSKSPREVTADSRGDAEGAEIGASSLEYRRHATGDPDSAAIPDAAGRADPDGAGERALAGGVVGAVTGAVLSAQGSDCAPDRRAVRSSFLGAFWGALRAALNWDNTRDLPLPDGDDAGGQEGPYPFEGQSCQADDHE